MVGAKSPACGAASICEANKNGIIDRRVRSCLNDEASVARTYKLT